MPSRRAISLSLLATSTDQSKETSGMVQPKPAASAISWRTWEPITNSFFGTQPRITQVPPIRYSSATMTLAPWLAAMRAARTPPDPPPMTKRSTSNSAISPLPGKRRLDRLVALLHLVLEFFVHQFGKIHRPLLHPGHALLNGARFVREQLLAEGSLVEGHDILQLLLGEFGGVDLRHAVADFLFPSRQIFDDGDRNFAEVLLVVEILLHQRVLGALDDAGHGTGEHRGGVLHREDFLGGCNRRRRSRLGRRCCQRARFRCRLLRHGGHACQRQCGRKACCRHDCRKTLHLNSP